jgi:hypothetical protein
MSMHQYFFCMPPRMRLTEPNLWDVGEGSAVSLDGEHNKETAK